MSLRALAKVRTFSDVVLFGNLFPSLSYVEKLLKGCDSAVDIGFHGSGWLYLVPFAGQKVRNDVWEATLRQSGGGMHASYTLGDILNPALTPGCVDAALCMDVIEHFPKADSKAVLEFIESLARRIVI